MPSIEEAIIEKLRSGPCCFDDVVTDLSNFSWGEVFVPWIACRGTDGFSFANWGTRPISSHLARSSRTPAPLHRAGMDGVEG